MRWAYGVTTVPKRINDLLPRTLASLKLAGFDQPRLFVDDCNNSNLYDTFGLEVTMHWPKVRVAGNWMLALWELYIRDPSAERYAIFQDDFVTYRNLRNYLEHCRYPDHGYLNLYTFPINQTLAPKHKPAWFQSNQMGKGAVALVFNLKAVVTLLQSSHFVNRPQDINSGHLAIDGGVVDSMNKAGFHEYCHSPSLVQHTGLVSSFSAKVHPLAQVFMGEEFDAREWIRVNHEAGRFPGPTTFPSLDAWERERIALVNAIHGDNERLQASTTHQQREHFTKLIRAYENKLMLHQREKPCVQVS